MVLPDPGGPTINRWWRPAAATSRAWRPKGCPLTSARSGRSGGGAAGGAGGMAGHVAPGPQDLRQLGQRRHAVYGVAPDQEGLPGVAQGHDQLKRCRGVGQGDHARDMAQGAVQPQLATEGQCLGAGRWKLARGHQHPDGDGQVEPGAPLRTPDGARLTVTRRRGHGSPLERRAARTRSRDSRTAASGRPTMVKPGRPLETWTSTETDWPTAPVRVAAAIKRACRRTVARSALATRTYPERRSPMGVNGYGTLSKTDGTRASGSSRRSGSPWTTTLPSL